MPKSFVHITFLFLFLTAITGVWMRLVILIPSIPLTDYSFLLHAHSHIAILGWTFLAGFIIFLHLNWQHIRAKRQAIFIVLATLIITSCMFVAFLLQGYAMYSIIFSLAHIAIEFWLAYFMYKEINHHLDLPVAVKRFLNGAIIALVISAIGPLSLGPIVMVGLKEAPIFEMAIYFYLHFQYNGWLYLLLIGLFLLMLHRKQIHVQQSFVQSGFWIYMIALFPGYILSVLWVDLGIWANVAAVFGALGQFIGVMLVLIAFFRKRTLFKKAFSSHLNMSFIFTFLLLFVKSIIEFGLLYEPLAMLVFDTRSIIIGYLHLTFLGFISIFLLTQYQMTGLLDEGKNRVLYGVGVFILGFLLNEAVLFYLGLSSWFTINSPFANELLFIASMILVLGILIIWSSHITKKTAD